MKVVIAGGSGFLGRALAGHLSAQGHQPVVLTRTPREAMDVSWDGATAGQWKKELDGAGVVLNMTGRTVNCIYTEANRREIIESRVNSIRALGDAIRQCQNPPLVWIQASSLAIYGHTDQPTTERSPHGSGFSVGVCEAWEAELTRQAPASVRTCVLRLGLVLGPDGGLLVPFRRLARLGLGGTVGSGGQYMSWIHMNDFLGMVMLCLRDQSFSGVFNATGPAPATNREFMRALRAALGLPWSPPVPSICVRFGARFIMKTEAELALKSMRCLPERFQQAGFTFEHDRLDRALTDIMSRWRK